jgi:hypothetical protein
MFKRPAQLFVIGMLAFVFMGLMAETASANHVNLVASASCDAKNNAQITFTASTWDPGQPDGNNGEVEILFNGSLVDTGAFTFADGQTFGGTFPAPGGNSSVTVTAEGLNPVWPVGDIVVVAIPTDCATGRFTGGGNEIDLANGVKITQGLELDCDANPSFNLEVNWAGNQFHLETFTPPICTSVNNPAPPNAPINTMVGTGTGRYDGTEGYTVVFTLVDNGGNGKSDTIAITIYQTSDPSNVILSFGPTTISGGNLQAHPDQR